MEGHTSEFSSPFNEFTQHCQDQTCFAAFGKGKDHIRCVTHDHASQQPFVFSDRYFCTWPYTVFSPVSLEF
jgi:hypothetical protein